MEHSHRYKSKATAWNGIWNWLCDNKYLSRKNTACYDNNQEYEKIVKEFLNYCDIPIHMRTKKRIAIQKTAEQIQARWDKFTKWLAENKQDLKTRNIYQPK